LRSAFKIDKCFNLIWHQAIRLTKSADFILGEVELPCQRLDSRSHLIESPLNIAAINSNIRQLIAKPSQRVIKIAASLRGSINLPIKPNKRITQSFHRILGTGRRLDKFVNS